MRYNLTLGSNENDDITVIIKDKMTGEEKTVGYLMLFRNYRIQIAMSSNGTGDLGSSRVLPYLTDIVEGMETETARAFIQGQILEAIYHYQRSSYFETDTHHLGAAILPTLEDVRLLDTVATRFLNKLTGEEHNTYYC